MRSASNSHAPIPSNTDMKKPVGTRLFLVSPHWFMFVVGGVLLSHILPGAVPSAWVGLASGFGMGPGVSQPLSPPTRLFRACSLLGFWCTHTVCACVVCLILHSGQRVCLCFLVLRLCLRGCLYWLLVPVTFTPCGASNSGLSTPSSLGNLMETLS